MTNVDSCNSVGIEPNGNGTICMNLCDPIKTLFSLLELNRLVVKLQYFVFYLVEVKETATIGLDQSLMNDLLMVLNFLFRQQ